MHIETDLDRIRAISRKRENENFTFCAFLRGCLSSRVDAIVLSVYREVSEVIDCRQCANCCGKVKPVFDLEDQIRFSDGLSLPVHRFRERYFVRGKNRPIFRKSPCPFLSGSLCSNYPHRPKSCRSYPHLHETDFSYRLDAVIDHLSICPIIFNVFEHLKGLKRKLGEGVIPYDPHPRPCTSGKRPGTDCR